MRPRRMVGVHCRLLLETKALPRFPNLTRAWEELLEDRRAGRGRPDPREARCGLDCGRHHGGDQPSRGADASPAWHARGTPPGRVCTADLAIRGSSELLAAAAQLNGNVVLERWLDRFESRCKPKVSLVETKILLYTKTNLLINKRPGLWTRPSPRNPTLGPIFPVSHRLLPSYFRAQKRVYPIPNS